MFVFFLIACLCVGCAEAGARAVITEVVNSYFNLTNANDCPAFVALFADPFQIEDPNGTPPVRSRPALLSNCIQGGQTFDVISVKPTFISIAGLGAAVNFHVSSVAKNGCRLDFDGTGPSSDCILFTSVCLLCRN